jgi:hypothetical protein
MIDEGYGRYTPWEALVRQRNEGAGAEFNQQDWRERDRRSANLSERCEFDRQIAESIAANRANRDAAAH